MSSARTQAESARTKKATSAPDVRKQRRYLRALLKEAIRGEREGVQKLLRPFVSENEEFLSWGITAKLGLIPRYNFYFLTDRRVGDLEITPLTGNFMVEMAYLHKIDALIIRQPSIILLRLALIILYGLVLVTGLVAAFEANSSEDLVFLVASLALTALAVVVVRFVVSPFVKRVFLHFRKSGMLLKLTGGEVGTFIFADRTKMSELANLSRQITDIKRKLDVEAA